MENERLNEKVKIRWFDSAEDRDSTLFGVLAFALVFYMLQQFKIELKEVIASLAGTVIGTIGTIIAFHFREKSKQRGTHNRE